MESGFFVYFAFPLSLSLMALIPLYTCGPISTISNFRVMQCGINADLLKVALPLAPLVHNPNTEELLIHTVKG